MKVKKRKFIWVIVVLIILVIAIFFTFFYTRKCSDAVCFNKALTRCSRASYINDAKDATWLYVIKGKDKGECEVDVEILQMKEGTADMSGLENKEMTCYITLGFVSSPQENLARCHGLLKEEMQDVIINRLHNYIVSNLGEISGELEKTV